MQHCGSGVADAGAQRRDAQARRAAPAGGPGGRACQPEGQRGRRLGGPGEGGTWRVRSETQVCSAPRSPVTLNLSLPSRPEATAAPPASLVPVQMPRTSSRVPMHPGGQGWPLPPPHFNLQWARQMPGTESLQSPGRQEPAILPFGSGSRGTERHFVAFLAQGGSDLKPPTAEAGEGPSKQSEQPWECQSEAEGDRRPHSRGDSTQARRRSRGAAALTCYDDFVAVQQELPSLSIPQLDGLCPVPRQLQQRPKAFWLLRDRKRDRVPRGCTRC